MVRSSQDFVSPNGFVEILLSFSVLRKDLAPRGSNEDLAMIAEHPDCSLHALGNRLIDEPKVSRHVGHPAIEENYPRTLLRHFVGTHFPTEHEFGKEQAVVPRQSVPAKRYLLLDDAASRFDRTLIVFPLECVEERTLSGTRTASDHDEALDVVHESCL
jgi:hypothetical protein